MKAKLLRKWNHGLSGFDYFVVVDDIAIDAGKESTAVAKMINDKLDKRRIEVEGTVSVEIDIEIHFDSVYRTFLREDSTSVFLCKVPASWLKQQRAAELENGINKLIRAALDEGFTVMTSPKGIEEVKVKVLR